MLVMFGCSRDGRTKDLSCRLLCRQGTITITNSTPGTTLVFMNATSGKPAMSHAHPDVGDLGGAVTVMAGTGAGQYRRLVTASHTPVIDQPFDTPIDSTSVIQIGPFRGRTIFYHNRYEDGGDWQLYGNAHDWIVSQQHMQRTVRATPAVTRVFQIRSEWLLLVAGWWCRALLR